MSKFMSIFAAGLALCNCLLLSPSALAGVPDSSDQLVIKIEVRAVIEKIEALPISKEPLVRKMLGAPDDHFSERRSREILAQWFRQRLEHRLETDLDAIAQSHSVTRDWVRGIAEEFTDDRKSAIDKATGPAFSEVFDAARDEAERTQWLENVDEDVFPSEEEVDAVEGDPSQERAVRERLRNARLRGPVRLFEDNEKKLEEGITKDLHYAQAQRRRQLASVSAMSAPGAFSDETIARSLIRELEDRIALEREANPEGKVYDLFPSVKAKIRDRAAALMKEKFEDHLRRGDSAPVDSAAIERLIEDSPAAHRSPERSRELVNRALGPPLGGKIIAEYSEQETDDAELPRKLSTLLEEDATARRVFEARIERELRPAFSQARERVVAGQRIPFGPLFSLEYRFDEDAIVSFHRSPQDKIRIEEVAQLLGVANFATLDDRLLDETRSGVEKRIDALLTEGERALVGQMTRADELLHDTGFRTELDAVIVEARKEASESVPEGEADFEEEATSRAVDFFVGRLTEEWTSQTNRRLSRIWPSQGRTEPVFRQKYLEIFAETRRHVRDLITPGLIRTALEPPSEPREPLETQRPPPEPRAPSEVRDVQPKGRRFVSDRPQEPREPLAGMPSSWLAWLVVLVALGIILWLWTKRRRGLPESASPSRRGSGRGEDSPPPMPRTGAPEKRDVVAPPPTEPRRASNGIWIVILIALAVLLFLLTRSDRPCVGDVLCWILAGVLSIVLLLAFLERRARVVQIVIRSRMGELTADHTLSGRCVDAERVEELLDRECEAVRNRLRAATRSGSA